MTGIVSLATVLGIALAGYQVGSAASQPQDQELIIEIENTISSVISSLPTEKQEEAKELLAPVVNLVVASSAKDQMAITEAKDSVRGILQGKSLVSYQADSSPFVPPLDKVQLLCDDEFLVTLSGLWERGASFRVATPQKSLGTRSLSPGEVVTIESKKSRLTLTVLEIPEDLKGPILSYSCG
ncbi:MAG: hypothetical protein AAFY88_10880 [Acidobacteriota bacterium]